MGCRILIAVEFDKSARSLLARATYLALSQHDAQVDIGHILSSSSESARQSEELSEQAHWLELQAREAHHPVEVRDIPFSPSAREVLAWSQEFCHDSSIGEVEVLLACLSLAGPRSPLPSLATVLEGAQLRRLLARKGFDLDQLERELTPYILPRPGTGTEFALAILAQFLTEGVPPADVLERCGLSLALLLELRGMCHLDSESNIAPVDFCQVLGSGWGRFSRLAQEAISLAWNLTGGSEMELGDFYRGTFVSPAVRRLKALPLPEIRIPSRPGPRAPQLSADVYRVIARALKLAGSGPVEVRHLLVALAEADFPVLKEAGITPAFLRAELEL